MWIHVSLHFAVIGDGTTQTKRGAAVWLLSLDEQLFFCCMIFLGLFVFIISTALQQHRMFALV